MRASRLGRYSWTMFDWANQPFYTLIMTFVFSVYFTDVFIVGEDGAQKLTLTQTISGLAIAILISNLFFEFSFGQHGTKVDLVLVYQQNQ